MNENDVLMNEWVSIFILLADVELRVLLLVVSNDDDITFLAAVFTLMTCLLLNC